MKNDLRSRSISFKMLRAAVVPAVVTFVVILCTAYVVIINTISKSVKDELVNMSAIASNTLEAVCPGDYEKKGDEYIAIYKGDVLLNNNTELLHSLIDGTDLDVTLFYGDLRVISSLTDSSGESLAGTAASVKLRTDVLETGKEAYYNNITLEGTVYYGYYKPIFDSDNECIGMLAVCKAADEVSEYTTKRLLPLIGISLLGMFFVAFISIHNATPIIAAIKDIKNVLNNITGGKLDSSVDGAILKRGDELADIGKSVNIMQMSLRKMIEIDELTQINNRRSGQKRLADVIQRSIDEGTEFHVAIGDIDFFKKVNDTYGHDAGDLVLKKVADILKNSMTGRGFVARWGGEEFLVVFNKGTYDEAVEHLNRVIKEVEGTQVVVSEDVTIGVTMSFGLTEGDTDKESHIILKEADERLYTAKTSGRNRVVSLPSEEYSEREAAMEEIWDIYDAERNLTGRTMSRNDWNMKPGDYHLTVLGVIERPDKTFLITQRVMDKAWAPGQWEVSGGACKSGENSFSAVCREVYEETGIDVSRAEGGFQFSYRRDNPDEGDNYFVDIYKFNMDISESDIKLQPEETAGFKFATLDEIKAIADNGEFLHYNSICQVFED